MFRPTRRDLVLGAAALSISMRSAEAAPRDPLSAAALDASVRAYDGFGVHRTGSAADLKTTQWLGRHMRSLGYRVETHPFAAELVDVARARLTVGGQSAALVLQEPSPLETLNFAAELRPLESGAELKGAIAYADFPYRRDPGLSAEPYAGLIARAAAAGAAALIAVTRGPTGDVIVFNVPRDGAHTPLPVLLIAPTDSAVLRSGASARLELIARRRATTAFNTLARLDRGGPRLIVSTPQSGWTHCAGERGPGIALWRALAEVIARQPGRMSALFLATSGHEVAHAGLESLLRTERRAFDGPLAGWIHLGANLATFDYDRTALALRLLPTPNPERGAAASPKVLPLVRQAFADVPAMPTGEAQAATAFGEARTILAAGFEPVVGLVGSGVFHHARSDRAEISTSGAIIRPLALALARLCRMLID